MIPSRPGLLVSVRSAAEAAAALEGGADLIDVKEPARGSLGRADDQAVRAVLATIAGRRPVSAARGELMDESSARSDGPSWDPGLHFVKWGLAGAATRDWRQRLEAFEARCVPQVVVVAYADWQCAEAPGVEEVVGFACRKPGQILLLDTHCKTPSVLGLRRRPNLLDWLTVDEVVDICRTCRAAGGRVALAGSLDLGTMELLAPACPDWFAVRSAACAAGERHAAIEADRVRCLSHWLERLASRRA